MCFCMFSLRCKYLQEVHLSLEDQEVLEDPQAPTTNQRPASLIKVPKCVVFMCSSINNK